MVMNDRIQKKKGGGKRGGKKYNKKEGGKGKQKKTEGKNLYEVRSPRYLPLFCRCFSSLITCNEKEEREGAEREREAERETCLRSSEL